MAKYLRIASDLHLDMYNADANKLADYVLPPNEKDSESILILAGDLSSDLTQLSDFLKVCSNRFDSVIAIPGNHEAYGHELVQWQSSIRDLLKPLDNVFYAEDYPECVIIDGVRFAFGILWADGGKTLADQGYVGHCLNDFFMIRKNQAKFTVPDMMAENKRQKKYIRNYLAEPFDGKTVIVSHHLPSYKLISERFMPKPPLFQDMNGGFACEADEFFEGPSAPALWVFGHTHDTIDTAINQTRLICNPRGYGHERNSPFNHYTELFVAIDEL